MLPGKNRINKDEYMRGVFEIYIETHFSAAHALRGYQGDCERLHGHNWIIQVYVRCRELDAIGIGIDFRIVKENVREVLKGLDHVNINELPAFQAVNPTSENIAQYLYRELGNRINSNLVSVSKVKVSETPTAGAFYWEE
jgi:6-pyruvoyltetrahydropterin/6-carboxytetrahydropterin synthase